MRKKIILLTAILSGANIFALGGVNVLTSPTASGLGNPVQQVEVSVDSVFYNPAALSFLEEGDYIGGGSAFVIPKYRGEKHSENSSTTVDIDNLILVPNIQYVKVKGRRAYYIGTGSMGQGGLLDPSIHSNSIDKMDMDYLAPGVVFGVSQKLNEDLSFSFGGRYTYVYQHLEIEGDALRRRGTDADGDMEITGGGIAPEIGVFYRATEKLDLSAKYLFRTKIDNEADVSGNRPKIPGVLEDHLTKRGDYPAVLSTGTSYKIDDKNKIFAGYNLIFESEDYVYGGGYGDTHEYMVGYVRTLNDKYKVECGYTYVDKGGNGGATTFQELDAQVVGVALRHKYNETTEFLYSLNANLYHEEQSSHGDIKSNAYRRETTFGVGVSKKI